MSKCNFASAQSSYLETHMRTHMMERPFRCNQCEITYKSKGGLTGRAGTHQIDSVKESDRAKPGVDGDGLFDDEDHP